MQLSFYKYQGTGNDFIVVDAMKDVITLTKPQILLLCNRRFGVGGDGLMIITKDAETDFLMDYYNADGNVGSMCGNGGRCIVSFAAAKKYIGDKTIFKATDGTHHAIIENGNLVRLQMGDVKKPVLINSDVQLNTGSPHLVRFVSAVDKINVVDEGKKIRYNTIYNATGINVNFVEMQNDCLYIRTYERGVEDETLSCGTGVTASVIAASFTNRIIANGKQKVKTPGGMLSVQFDRVGDEFKNVWLEGEATFVYEGKITIV